MDLAQALKKAKMEVAGQKATIEKLKKQLEAERPSESTLERTIRNLELEIRRRDAIIAELRSR